MDKEALQSFHEMITTESNSVVIINKLIKFLKKYSINEQKEILENILILSQQNNDNYLKEIKKLQDLLEKQKPTQITKKAFIDETKPKKKEKIQCNDNLKNYALDIQKIISLNEEQLLEFLENTNSENIDYYILGLLNELKTYQMLGDEAYLIKDLEFLKELRETTAEIQQKISLLKAKKMNFNVNREEKKDTRIIFLETSSGRNYFFQDIVGLEAKYSSFSKLFHALKQNDPLDTKRFYNNLSLKNVTETRDVHNQTRIFFDKITENTYIIVLGLVKKETQSAGYYNQLLSRYKYYEQVKPQIITSLNNPDFILRQEAYLEEIENLLDLQSKTKKKEN